MTTSTILYHYGTFQPLWSQQGLIQAGPQIKDSINGLSVPNPRVEAIISALKHRDMPIKGVLLQYTDPFLIRSAPLRGLNDWPGPRILACGDLHHGPDPIETLVRYIGAEFHDGVLLTFNPALLADVRRKITVPVRALPPSFFRYPSTIPAKERRLQLLHVGSLGSHHPRRRKLVTELHSRERVPFQHATTNSAEKAAALYAKYALVLNVPLNHDLNHRFFEVMACGVPQVVFGEPGLVGNNRTLAERPDVFWASSMEELETLVLRLFAEPEKLRSIPVNPPSYWQIQNLIKEVLAP